MQYLINEYGTGITLIILFIGFIISIYIFYVIIKAAVKDGTSNQRELLERQNEILKEYLKNRT